jgi:FMN reductase
MSRPTLVGLSRNTSRPSKTQASVSAIVQEIESRQRVNVELFDLVDVLPELARTTDPRLADPNVARLIDAIESADGLVVGTAVQKGAYSGLFKHLFDLVDARALAAKPVILSATGGSECHALVIEPRRTRQRAC